MKSSHILADKNHFDGTGLILLREKYAKDEAPHPSAVEEKYPVKWGFFHLLYS